MPRLSDLTDREDFRLWPLSVSPARRHVDGPAGSIQVEPLVMHVFLSLVDARGGVVTRSHLFEHVWGGAMVGDDSLNRTISAVRRIAAAVGPGLFEVETIPRTGYRMTGDIFACPEQAEPAPFGRKVSRRRVIGGAGAAIVATAAGAWVFDRLRGDNRFEQLVAEGDQILRYDHAPGGVTAAIKLEEALALRPGDARALGLLAYAHALTATGPSSTGPQEVSRAERAIKAALAADPNDPHAGLALLLFQHSSFDWAGSEDRLHSILAAAPGNTIALGSLGALYQASGRLRRSWTVNRQRLRIDPYSPSAHYRRALQLWIFGRVAEADQVIDRQIAIWPQHPWVWNARFLIFAFTGRSHAALDMIANESTRPATITPALMAQWRPTLAALDTRKAADIAEARAANLAAARQSPGQAAYAIMALSGMGAVDEAVQVAEGFLLSRGDVVIRRPRDERNLLVNAPNWRNTQWLSTPPMAAFRADPRFDRLCDEIGLTAYWRLRGITPDYGLSLA